MAFLPLIMAILQAFPQILAVIKTIEAEITMPKMGAVKKAMVMAAVTTPDADPKFVDHVSSLIDNSVAGFNAAKVFKISNAPVAP